MQTIENRVRRARSGKWPACRRRAGMTLIELLVVITILTTLVAGVIPILSPNNDVRKIREASRALQTYISGAQAAAARTGRPHGIALREGVDSSGIGSGATIELFRLEVPQHFAGFSETSAVVVASVSNPPTGDVTLTFGEGLYSSFTPDAGNPPLEIPPRFLRPGDILRVAGFEFEITLQDPPNNTQVELYNGVEYVVPSQVLDAVWREWHPGKQMAYPRDGRPYEVRRQPTPSASSPLQLPRGIGIDLTASGPNPTLLFPNLVPSATNPPQYGFTTWISQRALELNGPPPVTFQSPLVVGILFGSGGEITEVIINGESFDSFDAFSQIHLLLGRVENAENDPTIHGPPHIDESLIQTNQDLEDLQAEYNWLNLDSRWVSIASRTGRVVTTENAFVDPRNHVDPSGYQDANRALRIQAAREFAGDMRQLGGD